MIRVLIADDSATCRSLMQKLLEGAGGFEVVGLAKNGREAVEQVIRLHPDIVAMDIHMPVMDGFEATREIMETAAIPVVIVTATADVGDVEVAMRAVRLGALAALEKPVGEGHPDFARASREVVDTIRAMAGVRVVRQHRPRPNGGRKPDREVIESSAPEIVAIAASTGGPAALQRICAAIPERFEAPLLVVQHMSHGFVDGFAQWLAATATKPVHVAADGQTIERNTIYVAPDDRHFGMDRRGRVALARDAPVNGFRPSGSYLFDSVSTIHGAGVLAIVLTGMGDDGASALPALRDRGGKVWVQDPRTAVVAGMPDAAIATGTVERVLSVERMIDAFVRFSRAKARPK